MSCAGILYYFSSTANPIIYNLMSRKFRRAFRRTLCCGWWCHLSTTCLMRQRRSFQAVDVDQRPLPLKSPLVLPAQPLPRPDVVRLAVDGLAPPPPQGHLATSRSSEGTTSEAERRGNAQLQAHPVT